VLRFALFESEREKVGRKREGGRERESERERERERERAREKPLILLPILS